MRRFKREYALLFWLVLGWLLAAVGVNRLFADGMVNYQVLYSHVTEGWNRAVSGDTGAALRILVARVFETLAVVAVCRSRFKGIGIPAVLLVMGMSAGASLVLLTWSRGVFGIVCFLASGFPQDLFYLAAWGLVLLGHSLFDARMPPRLWAAVAALLAFGICGEIWLGPVILRLL